MGVRFPHRPRKGNGRSRKRPIKTTKMTLIRKPHEITVPKTLKCLIYGQAGTGKTTLALSAPSPLLLDFDGGAKRLNAKHAVDTVQITSMADCDAVLREDLSAYETIVVDTVGKMIDFIISDVCKGRLPQLRDWGAINNRFTAFCHELSRLNKNIIFVAHRDNRKEGDNNVFIPAIREKNYNSIVTELDLMGYLESRDNRRVITFDFSDRNDGKNTCDLPHMMPVTTLTDNVANDFFTKEILSKYVAKTQKAEDVKKQYFAVVQQIKDDLELVSDAETMTLFAKNMKSFAHVGGSREVARTLAKAKAQELGLVYNATNNSYEQANA